MRKVALLILGLLLCCGPAWSNAELPQNRAECLALCESYCPNTQCVAVCDQYFPGGGGGTTPPPPVTSKPFPHTITFERDSDQGNGAAAILFRKSPDNWVNFVSVNGEVARKGVSYKGASVFLLTKSGDKYARPLKFVIKTVDGGLYTATSGSSGGGGGTTPTGSYKNKATYDSYGVRNKRQAWRINKRGDSLGPGPIRFTFSSGIVFTVKSTAKNCRDNENTCQRDSKSSKLGFVFKPGNGAPNGEGDSDIGTSHKGIYLHSPYGDKSPRVTMEW